jgi:signal transduction histidine kinase
VVLQVEDDGQGFEPEAHQALGILGMQERAAALGGEVTVRSAPGRGTTVAARLPQAPAAAAEVAA